MPAQIKQRRDQFTLGRLPKHLQESFAKQRPRLLRPDPLRVNEIYQGDAAKLLSRIQTESIALSVWSPPYFVGKSYESGTSFEGWRTLLREVIAGHFAVVKPGGFLVINIADILCFKDESMPKVQAENLTRRRSAVTRELVESAMHDHPLMNRYQIAKFLGCSEQTVDRRLNGNNIRGGKYDTQTRIRIVGGMLEEWALAAGFFPYDRRIWAKDPAWENSKWASLSYRAVDEFEYLYFYWKPGVTTIDRGRLTQREWKDWGSRGVWSFPSVRVNDDHEAKFPLELPKRAIRLLTEPGETVLDCFIGSGTTAVASVKTGRSFIGIELEQKSVDLAKRNVAHALAEIHPKVESDVH